MSVCLCLCLHLYLCACLSVCLSSLYRSLFWARRAVLMLMCLLVLEDACARKPCFAGTCSVSVYSWGSCSNELVGWWDAHYDSLPCNSASGSCYPASCAQATCTCSDGVQGEFCSECADSNSNFNAATLACEGEPPHLRP